jgi:hypothetical protein
VKVRKRRSLDSVEMRRRVVVVCLRWRWGRGRVWVRVRVVFVEGWDVELGGEGRLRRVWWGLDRVLRLVEGFVVLDVAEEMLEWYGASVGAVVCSPKRALWVGISGGGDSAAESASDWADSCERSVPVRWAGPEYSNSSSNACLSSVLGAGSWTP